MSRIFTRLIATVGAVALVVTMAISPARTPDTYHDMRSRAVTTLH